MSELLGIRIDGFSQAESILRCEEFLDKPGQNIIVTVNPEMLVKANKDEYFASILNASNLALCDGKGIEIFAKPPVKRVTGVDFLFALCARAEQKNISVFLLGSGDSKVVQNAAFALQKKFPLLKIAGYHEGPQITEVFSARHSILDIAVGENEKILETIAAAKPEILFVGFGMGKQEKWIYENIAKLPSVRIAMGVGGTFDFISGVIRRSPLLLRNIGLEWLWRLLVQPQRFTRIWNATVVFTFLVIMEKIKNFYK